MFQRPGLSDFDLKQPPRLAHLKVLAEENCSLECNQVEAESELEIAAQALIQLSEAQRRHVRGEAYTL
ncbi:hypothetical protein chiPu_0022003 [Chiloscyllium punctatum]|uniref:Uncharacterized protein n=1 Tax=Chiloscyllium punctatum TaxID=137246 RepID=A0A401RH97_CHIPU|nr:hypothetical protein [Chiloscyllium punctatum]